ncbi:MAG: hypothetical protein ACYCO9_01030 [Streptosporangiaceae bacterium]
MIWHRDRPPAAPVPVLQRYRQAFEVGEVALAGFTRAELGAVTLDPHAIGPEERGRPLYAGPAEPGTGPAATDPATALAGATDPQTAARLVRRGFVRDWPPAPPTGPVTEEMAGWLAAGPASPAGQAAPAHPVTLVGDLAIIARFRGQPTWIAEASAAAEPARPDPAVTRWRLTGRMYAPQRPAMALAEAPPDARGEPAPYVLLRDDRAMTTLLGWCGVDVPGFLASARTDDPGRFAPPPGAYTPPPPMPPVPPSPAVPTAGLGVTFGQLCQVCFLHPVGDDVVVRSLIVGSAGTRHWALTGRSWELAVPVRVEEISQRLAGLIEPPSGAAG